MAVQVIAGAAKVAHTAGRAGVAAGRAGGRAARVGARVAGRTGRGTTRMRPRSRRARNQMAHSQRTQTMPSLTQNRAVRTAKSIKRKTRKVKATLKSFPIAWSLIWFYPVQLFFAFVYVIAVGFVNMDGVVGWWTEDIAKALMMLSWLTLIALGTGFMLGAALAFFVLRVRVWRHPMALLGFAVCLWGYWAPYLFFFPWVFLWLVIVIWAQK